MKAIAHENETTRPFESGVKRFALLSGLSYLFLYTRWAISFSCQS